MRVALVYSRRTWEIDEIEREMQRRGVEILSFRPSDFSLMIDDELRVLPEIQVDAIYFRGPGKGSWEEITARMNIFKILNMRIPVVNSPESIERCVDKMEATIRLFSAGIPVPETLITENDEISEIFVRRIGRAIKKPLFGSRGEGVRIIERGEKGYLQRFLEHGGRDIRTFVIGRKVLGAVYRIKEGSPITNVARGGRTEICELDDELKELSILSARALGAEICGVDIAEEGGRRYVLEVNSSPSWKGFQKATQINVASEIAEYFLKGCPEHKEFMKRRIWGKM
ncbi:MAG: RimK family alpha-L-glutamate ligase [Archaeoglobi archaeon]|nr:RimK family alpha-L-glutamate ligase [Candidatus Mnemosynella sp.]